LGGAGGVTVGKECLFVGLAAGLVEREVPVGVRAEVVQPAQWEFLVAWQVAGDVAYPPCQQMVTSSSWGRCLDA
jgi:hypothetical protein